MLPRIALMATVETKAEETRFLEEALTAKGCAPLVVDLSLAAGGDVLSGEGKRARMAEVAETTSARLAQESVDGAVAIGGGTGGQIALDVLRSLPLRTPKMLVTTLPFDPRSALADDAIMLVPTLVDIAGLNGPLRRALLQAATMMAAVVADPLEPDRPAVGLTALGVTCQAADAMVEGLRVLGHETLVFHANGYGGAGFARFAREGGFSGVIDMTVHEITRYEIAGVFAPTPDRFSCAVDLPRVVLPGGLNFLGLGRLEDLPAELRARPHYRHSTLFTHVAVSDAEMDRVAERLATELNAARKATTLLLPMGGFSNEDCPGGAIENPTLRDRAADILEAEAERYRVERLTFHINEPETARAAIEAITRNMAD